MSNKSRNRAGSRNSVVTTPVAQGMVAHLLRRSVQICVAVFLDQMRAYGITPTQYAVLVTAHDYPGQDQRRLGFITSIDRTSLSGALQRLELRGLIERPRDPKDQRVRQVSITAEGRKLLIKTRADLDQVQARILAPLQSTEQAQLLGLLHKLVEGHRSTEVPLE